MRPGGPVVRSAVAPGLAVVMFFFEMRHTADRRISHKPSTRCGDRWTRVQDRTGHSTPLRAHTIPQVYLFCTTSMDSLQVLDIQVRL